VVLGHLYLLWVLDLDDAVVTDGSARRAAALAELGVSHIPGSNIRNRGSGLRAATELQEKLWGRSETTVKPAEPNRSDDTGF
jgi:hypothetical protein